MPLTRLSTTAFFRPRAIVVSLMAVAVAALVCAARTYSSGVRPKDARAVPTNTPSKSDQNEKAGMIVETELIALTPTGFEPAEVTRPAGEFILMVENRTRQPVSLSLARETGERLHEMKESREEPDWNELENLTPGRYLLTEADHPEWTCSVTITAR